MHTVAPPPTTDFKLGFDEPPGEIDARPTCRCEGECPPGCTGSLVRLTPAKFDAGDKRLKHWFDGSGDAHPLRIGGRPRRRTPIACCDSTARTRRAATASRADGEFATDPCRSLFKRVQPSSRPRRPTTRSQPGPARRALPRDDRDADAGRLRPGDARDARPPGLRDSLLGLLTTAHPHHDRGATSSSTTSRTSRPQPRTALHQNPGGAAATARMTVRQPGYVHCFGLTERFFVLGEFPLRGQPAPLASRGKPFIENFRWEPDPARASTVRPGDRRAPPDLRGRSGLLLPPRQRLRARRRAGRGRLRLRGCVDHRRALPRRLQAGSARPPGG